MAPKAQILPGTSQANGPYAGRQLWSGQRPAGDPAGWTTEGEGLHPSAQRLGSPTMTYLDAPFAARHIGPSPDNVAKMLATVGYGSVDQIMDVAIPEPTRFHGPLALPDAETDAEV